MILNIFFYYIITITTMIQSKFTYRGFMLDTSRKFFPISSIKTMIDYMSEANLNTFHWHLIDNEGFNIELDYDNGSLTKHGSLNGKFYTKLDLIEIINYANKYNIQVLPEFDFPGHARAFGKVYPDLLLDGYDDELDLNNRNVFHLLKKIFYEFIPIFNTTKFVHFGHDESSNTKTQLTRSLKFSLNIANKYKKIPIVWDDIITNFKLNKSKYKSFILQVWQNIDAMNNALDLEYETIISLADYFYIGNDISSPKNFIFPDNKNIIGFEVVWFTSEGDDENDVSWIKDFIMECKNL